MEDGSKTHTIRAIRKIPPKVGETCYCYVDPRQKTMRLLGRFRCVRVQEIIIELLADEKEFTLLITIDDVELTLSEASAFAYRDGFRCEWPLNEMHRFWVKAHGATSFPFQGHLIHWEFKPGTANAKPAPQKRRAGGKP